MKITVMGPNLPRPLCDKGDMHVHAAGCADLRRYPKGIDQGGWTINVEDVRSVVVAVYDNMIDESGLTWEDYVSDLYWAPCTSTLPHDVTVAESFLTEHVKVISVQLPPPRRQS